MFITVYYDGSCPFCSSSANLIERLDWRHKLKFIDLHLPGVLEKAGIGYDKAMERIHVRINEHEIFEGIDAIFNISLVVPLLWLYIPIFWLAKKIGFGNQLYDWVAKRRFLFPAPGYCKLEK